METKIIRLPQMVSLEYTNGKRMLTNRRFPFGSTNKSLGHYLVGKRSLTNGKVFGSLGKKDPGDNP